MGRRSRWRSPCTRRGLMASTRCAPSSHRWKKDRGSRNDNRTSKQTILDAGHLLELCAGRRGRAPVLRGAIGPVPDRGAAAEGGRAGSDHRGYREPVRAARWRGCGEEGRRGSRREDGVGRMSVQRVIPVEWLPEGKKVWRVILHWTGGAYTVSGLDKQHYHAIIDKAGHSVKGDTPAGSVCAHTRNLNSGSYGLSIAAMAGAQEGGPYGSFPMLELQYERVAQAAADVVAAYDLAVTPRTVLCHQEVTFVYGPEAD